MDSKEFLNKFKSSFLWANLLAMVLVVIVCVMGVKFGLDTYTHHGEVISIPDVRRRSFDDAERILKGLGFNVMVVDTGYVKTLPADAVLELSPEVGQKVKTGRTIYLTINASNSPVLSLPDVIDNCSFREAQAKLTAMGFLIGEPQYITGEKDWVYGVKCNGRSLAAGDRVSIEDKIVLQVGSGQRDSNDSLVVTDAVYDNMPERGDFNGGEVDNFQVVE